MPTLHVRSVPEELYQRLQSLAIEQNRSLSAQVVTLLEQAVTEIELLKARQSTIQSIRRRRFVPPSHLPDSNILLREDRSR